jgi:septal ring factor EnvC (AmiA/AmiB activator)
LAILKDKVASLTSILETQSLDTERLAQLEREGKDKLDELDALKTTHDSTLANLLQVESRLDAVLKGAESHEELRSTWLREIDEKRRVSTFLIF